ncbi:hypothetical protein QC763_310335 [Podospora pseudopauciseta]|uniref:Uncharacterized protein n=1 Tax=Podospora pseudopauciseta TaxID=2093780 RepID=A0ABR0HI57_9PEZI|nr:hypothetical protein QC763_310335 [Podospora pseudopauciseta]
MNIMSIYFSNHLPGTQKAKSFFEPQIPVSSLRHQLR